jgi:hypothetical protein
MDDWTPEMDEAFNEIEKQSNLGKQILKEIERDWRKNASAYERGFIDGMQKQMQSSVDKAVNAIIQRKWVGLTDAEVFELIRHEGTGDSDINPLKLLADATRIARIIEAKLKQKNGYAEEKNT